MSLVGSYIAERYQVLDVVASGGCGSVFKVKSRETEKICAAKVLRIEGAKETSLQRLQQEGKLLCNLKHPNIVSVHAMTLDPKFGLVLIMDYLDGVTLSQYSKDATLSQKLLLVEQVCDGLQFVHANGVIHRDIKPSNVMVVDGRAVLIDFGISKTQDDLLRLTATNVFLGTPGYMSPEYCLTGQSDYRSDIYAMGCLLFEVVAGSPPFVGSSPLEVMSQHINAPIPSLPVAGDKIGSMQIVIDRCLRKDPSERYSSCIELKQDIAAVRQGKHLIPPTVHRREPKLKSKYLSSMVLAAAAVTIGLGIAATFMLAVKREEVAPIPIPDGLLIADFRESMNAEHFDAALQSARDLRTSYLARKDDPQVKTRLIAEARLLEAEALHRLKRQAESEFAYEEALVGFEKAHQGVQVLKCLKSAAASAMEMKNYPLANRRLTRAEQLDDGWNRVAVQMMLAETEINLQRQAKATTRLHNLLEEGDPEGVARAQAALDGGTFAPDESAAVSPAKTR